MVGNLRGKAARRVATRWLLAGGLALATSLAWPADPFVAQARNEALRALQSRAQVDFELPGAAEVDAPLRQRIEALVREHHTRIAGVATTWIDEIQASADLRDKPLVRVLMARYFNELVLSQIDRVDSADDERLLRAHANAATCAAPQANQGLGRWAAMLQRLPEAERDADLRAQATRLARWGQPRADLPPRPAVPWMSAHRAALASLRAPDRPPGEPPAPPMLVWTFLLGKADRVSPAERCALATWMLQREPLRQAPPAARADQLRLALAWDPAHDLGRSSPGPAGDDYPPVARLFMVKGTVRVEGRVNASGSGLEAPAVVRREISVEGLRAPRLAAFEALFDDASLQRAAATKITSAAPGTVTSLSFVWRLE
ncbi:MAG: hypothetical protein CFE32_16555 [Alphaproteobacteria bacterium PA3]|nr:MAG: hypothetical protein CFE32_16555 [Alphaproteobacteria bacterium PA3]